MISELNDNDYQYEEKLLANNDSNIVLQSHKIELLREKLNNISKYITSLGNFSIQYNFQSISIALLVMSTVQCTITDEECKQGLQETWVTSTTSAVIFIGAIIGQLVMGTAGDILGRDKAMHFTLCLSAIGALSSSILSFGNADKVYIIIICCRFILGIGLGGVYPLSATKAAEDSSEDKGKVDTFAACMSYFWQVPGTMFPWLIALIFTYTDLSTNMKWRLLLSIGSIPSFIAVILSIIESKYRKILAKILIVNNDIDDKTDYGLKASNHMKLMLISLKNKEIITDLIATGGGWFIYDAAYYGVNLFGGQIIQAISEDTDDLTSNSSIRSTSLKQIIALGTAIPATILSIWLLKKIGTKKLQISGFILMAFSFLLLSYTFNIYKKKSPNLMFAIYCLLLFSLNYGPNVSTYVLSAETYRKDIRSTFNGISAALGKLGAAFGAAIFGPVAIKTSYPFVMILCSVLSLIGAIISQYFIKNKSKYNLITEERSSSF